MSPWRTILGVFLIILGVIGIFLPILQGLVLIALGVLVLKKKPIGEQLDRIHPIKRLRARKR